jgi:hypothetical protein
VDTDVDSKSSFRAMARKHKFNYLIGWTDGKLAESLVKLTKFSGVPQTIIIRDGQIKGFFLGGSKTANEKIRETVKTIVNEK